MILVQFDAETGKQDIEFTKWVESLTQKELQVEVLKLYDSKVMQVKDSDDSILYKDGR